MNEHEKTTYELAREEINNQQWNDYFEAKATSRENTED